MERLKNGEVIQGISGKNYQILKFLYDESLSTTYLITCGEEQKVLKWYDKAFSNYSEVYQNIRNKFDRGEFSSCFWYPVDITDCSFLEDEVSILDWDIDGPLTLNKEKAFGCIFNLLPNGFVSLSSYIASPAEAKFKDITEISLKLLSAFRIMHLSGYCYQNLNDNEILINLETKDVLITGFENIVPNGFSSIGGTNKARYLAPELYESRVQNIYTSRYSLYIILFMLMFRQHPLEGKKWLVPCLTSNFESILYVKEPIFIMDPLDKTNEPEPDVHKHFINVWNCTPQYLKNLYVNAFNKDSFYKPNTRLREIDFLKVYTRFYNDIIDCDCSNEIFCENKREIVCDNCNKHIETNYIIKFPKGEHSIVVQKGTRLYRCQFGVTSPGKDIQPILLVVASKDDGSLLGLKNLSSENLVGTTPSGKKKNVPSGAVVPLIKGIQLDVFGTQFEIDEI